MMHPTGMAVWVAGTLATVIALGCASDQVGRPEQSIALYEEIGRMDDEVSAAFNAHDTRRLMTLFTSDLEFYHDQDGLQGFAQTKEGFTNMLSGDNGMQRELVKGTLEVYPLKGFGAIEIGTHRFCHREGARSICGTFRFVHVWKREDDGWKIARVVSYGHQ